LSHDASERSPSEKDAQLIFFGAVIGAILSKLLDWVITGYYKSPLRMPLIPEAYYSVIDLSAMLFIFLLLGAVVTYSMIALFRRLG
jgi:hypothetical protein